MGEWRIEELPETLKPDDLVELEHLHLAHDEIHGFRVYMVREEAHRLLHLLNLRDHELARLAERIKVTALQDGFWVNPRVTEDYDPETEQYALLVDNTQGDKGHPLLECYYREPLLAILDALKAQATGGQ